MRLSNILAIDPGPERSGWVVWCPQTERAINANIDDNESLLKYLRCEHFQSAHSARRCAIEMVACYGMAVGASVFRTCVWIGKFENAWDLSEAEPAVELLRQDIKLHICHDSRARDANIRRALLDRFEPELTGNQRPKGALKGIRHHMWSALAVAVTYADQMRDAQ